MNFWRRATRATTSAAVVLGVVSLWMGLVRGPFDVWVDGPFHASSWLYYPALAFLLAAIATGLAGKPDFVPSSQQQCSKPLALRRITMDDSFLEDDGSAYWETDVSYAASATANESGDVEDCDERQLIPKAKKFYAEESQKRKLMCPPDPCPYPRNAYIGLPEPTGRPNTLADYAIALEEEESEDRQLVPQLKAIEHVASKIEEKSAIPEPVPEVETQPQPQLQPQPRPQLQPKPQQPVPGKEIQDTSTALVQKPTKPAAPQKPAPKELPFNVDAAAVAPVGMFYMNDDDHSEWIVYERRKKVRHGELQMEMSPLTPEELDVVTRLIEAGDEGHRSMKMRTIEAEKPVESAEAIESVQAAENAETPASVAQDINKLIEVPGADSGQRDVKQDGKQGGRMPASKRKSKRDVKGVQNGEELPETETAETTSINPCNVIFLGVLALLITMILSAVTFLTWDEFMDYVKEVREKSKEYLEKVLNWLTEYKIPITVVGVLLLIAGFAVSGEESGTSSPGHQAITVNAAAAVASPSHIPSGVKEYIKITYALDIPEELWLAYKHMAHSFYVDGIDE